MYVLLVLFFNPYHAYLTAERGLTQEFTSKANCEVAAKVIMADDKLHTVDAFCVKK